MSLRQRVVFVDPEDDAYPYWWPALIVPPEYIHLFQQSINEQVPLSPSDLVVCYFEDGSFSVVPEQAIRPFNMDQEPFISYQSHPEMGRRFLSDRAVLRAIKFHREGIVPLSFTWLHSSVGPEGKLMEPAKAPGELGRSMTEKVEEAKKEGGKQSDSKQAALKRELKNQDLKREAARVEEAQKEDKLEQIQPTKEMQNSQRGRKRRNQIMTEPSVKMIKAHHTIPNESQPVTISRTTHEDSKTSVTETFVPKTMSLQSTSSLEVEYKVIKSLLPVPKAHRIKQIICSN